FCIGCFVVPIVGRLRRPFVCVPFLRASASPRGGAMTTLPFHGRHGIIRESFSTPRGGAMTALPFHGSHGVIRESCFGSTSYDLPSLGIGLLLVSLL
ncbi:MAG: hypothetical protein NC248_02140, partial [Bacteroides sp.]|nr:hypothetical protein [Bacteroides sp.]MCM1389441.1 hypothetical protein [Bacteroides sp.]